MTDRPSARYGRQGQSRRVRRWIVIGLTLLVLAAGAVVAAVGYHRLGRSDVSGTLAGYRLVDDETVEVTITVTRDDPSQPAVCIVRGKSKDGSETGRREVLVPPSTQSSVQVTTIVKTNRPPVMGDVYGCGLHVPAYLVPQK
ncbi:MAG TPA: DUF4307 domain-containing protein [Mycobacterium sp.]|jgi:hypothetical protein